MKLKRNQLCPLHRRRDCCGRPDGSGSTKKRQFKWETVRPGVRRIRDQHADHPDGYRYKLSRAEMDKVLFRKVQDQDGCCFYCRKKFQAMNEVTPDHKEPRGLGGSRRDDRADNIVAACWPCNREKGSQRL